MKVPLSVLILGLVLAEIAAFILVGGAIGVLGTLALTLLGMVAGSMLLRWSGVATLVRMRAEIAARRLPARPLADGAMLAIAAFLIMAPGFITDILGILLLTPPVRGMLWRRLGGRLAVPRESRNEISRGRGSVVELDASEYAAEPRPESRWRRDGRGRG